MCHQTTCGVGCGTQLPQIRSFVGFDSNWRLGLVLFSPVLEHPAIFFQQRLGYPERCYAWILDKLSCEKQRGSSMYIAMWRPKTG